MSNGTNEGGINFNQVVQSGQAAQSNNDSNQDQEGGQHQQYVSKDEFKQAQETLERKLQGLVDSNISRVDKRVAEAVSKVNEFVEMSKSSGVQITTEQVQQMKDKAVTQALSKADAIQGDVSGGQQVAQSQAQQVQEHPALAAAKAYMRTRGVTIDEGDPEIDKYGLRTESDPEKFLAVVIAAADEKLERLASKSQTPAGAPGVLGKGSASGNLIEQYKNEIAAAAGKGNFVGREIRDRYRNMGVDVDNIGWRR